MRNKMFKKKKDIPSATKNIIGIIISGIICVIISVLLTLIFAYAFAHAEIISKSVGAIFVGCILISGFFCGLLCSRLTTFKGIIAGIISSSIYLLFATIIMLFFSSGRLSSSLLLMYIGTIVVSAIGGIYGANIKRRK